MGKEKLKRRVLIHSLIFPPDQVSTSYLYGDIVRKMRLAGFEVTVITTTPHYNYSDNFRDVSTFQLLWRTSNFEGAKVYHISQKKSTKVILRIGYLLWFHFIFLILSLTIRHFDYILTPSPPITSGLLSGIVAKIRRCDSIYNVQEVYPDVLIKQGNIKNSSVIALLKCIEKWTYRLSTKVVTIDDSFSEIIKSRLEESKLITIPNFIDTELYKPFEGSYDKELHFSNKFIVGYVGNLGMVQDWESIISVVGLLEKKNRNIHFLIIGGGVNMIF